MGIKRRQNAELDGYLQELQEDQWIDCPVGITSREKKNELLRTRVQEVKVKPKTNKKLGTANPEELTDEPLRRIFVVDSDERLAYEVGKRTQSMERTRFKLEGLKKRVMKGKLKKPELIGAAAERILQKHHGYRYFGWEFKDGVFNYFEEPVNFEREKRLEGKYVIATSEKGWTPVDAVQHYKELMEVERSFRNLKDVLEMRPIFHRVKSRIEGHIFIAFLALLIERLLTNRLKESKVKMSAEHALQAMESLKLVEFNVDEKVRRGISRGTPRAMQILKALGIENLSPPNPPEDQTTIM